MLKQTDVKIISLFQSDLDKISQYAEQNFSKGKYTPKTVNSTWINPAKKLNPNFTGIVGEWALTSENEPSLAVVSFLGERPLFSDTGDGTAYPFMYPRAVTGDGVTFDIKTGGWTSNYQFSLFAKNFRALLIRRLDINGRCSEKNYDKIEAFVFGVLVPDKMHCVFTGWCDKVELFNSAELVTREFEVEGGTVTHEYYAIPHFELKPLPDLLCRGFSRITTLTMKGKDNKI